MSDVALRNAAADGAGTDLEGRFFALGSDASTQNSNERLAPTYDPAASSAADLAATLSFTGPASTAVSHLLVFAASSGGSVQFAEPLSGDLAYNASGDLNLTSAEITVADAP